jgi:hypothetical protein
MNSRWKNIGLWTSTVTNVVGVALMVGLAPDKAKLIIAVAGLVIGFLNQAGIISNPTSGAGYPDEDLTVKNRLQNIKKEME